MANETVGSCHGDRATQELKPAARLCSLAKLEMKSHDGENGSASPSQNTQKHLQIASSCDMGVSRRAYTPDGIS